MQIKVFGAAREVGRSAILLEAGHTRVLLDYGIKLDGEVEYPLPLDGLVDGIIISHAHLDHSGYVPHYFTHDETTVYLTPPTLDLSKLLWKDFIKVAKMQGRKPKFNKEHVKNAVAFSLKADYYELIPVTPELSFEFRDAGHIPGSALTKLYTPEGTVLYTGDFKIESTRLQRGADLSEIESDILIMETTYADKDHPPRKELEKEFVEYVRNILDNGGFVLLPVFAVGRAQEIVDILVSNKIGPVYLDGMARDATKIILRHPEYITNPKRLAKSMRRARWVKGMRAREAVLEEPCVIVTTAGMLQGGPVRHYLMGLKDDPKSAIVFTGYQVEDSPGRRVLEEGIFEVDGYEYPVKMQIKYFDFSAHAGRSELFEIAERVNPQYVVLVHGDEDKLLKFKKELEDEGFEVFAPKLGDVVRLKL